MNHCRCHQSHYDRIRLSTNYYHLLQETWHISSLQDQVLTRPVQATWNYWICLAHLLWNILTHADTCTHFISRFKLHHMAKATLQMSAKFVFFLFVITALLTVTAYNSAMVLPRGAAVPAHNRRSTLLSSRCITPMELTANWHCHLHPYLFSVSV